MANIRIENPPGVNLLVLDTELRAALGDATSGLSLEEGGALTVHLTGEGPADALRPQIAAVIASHDPKQLTPEQQLDQQRGAASVELANADFKAVLAQINAASSMADLKPLLRSLLRLQYKVALAAGLTSRPNPEAP